MWIVVLSLIAFGSETTFVVPGRSPSDTAVEEYTIPLRLETVEVQEPPVEELQPEPPPPPEERWPLMRTIQGKWPGVLLDDYGLKLYGWIDMSYNASSAAQLNSPVVWDDRANEYLLQQVWLRFEKPVVTEGTTAPTFGFRTDWLYGTDYRFTLPRGLWNSQLLNADGAQNLYGFDAISFYVEGYFPSIAQGTSVKVGRVFTPFGVESLEAVSNPLVSKSYAFNWCPPFTHCGVLATTKLNEQWTVQYGAVNGNDVFFGDPAEEWRYLGTVKWTHPDGRTTATLATSFGRGKFNAADPFNPATLSLMTEPAGRNNLNVFDLVVTQTLTDRLSCALEVIYGYQTNVPANVPGGIIKQNATSGTAHWGSIAGYLFATWTSWANGVLRLEVFDDFEGQRTGFEGVYCGATAGFQLKPCPWIAVRPELRYDYNKDSRPFEGKHWLFTAAADLIVRW